MTEAYSEARVSVLVIAHNAVAASNRQRIEALAALPRLDVTLLTPEWWFEEGARISASPGGMDSPFAWHVGSTLATGNGTRHLYLRGLFSLVKRLRPRIVDVQEEPFSLAALQALLARNLLAPDAALVFYSAVNVRRRWRAPYRLIERMVLAGADGAYAPNAEVPIILAERGLRAPAHSIPLGVDVGRFSHARALEPTDAPRRIGFLGRLEPVKGLDVLLDAAARMRHPGRVIIAGEGTLHDHLQARIATEHLNHRVQLQPAIPHSEVPSFLATLDVLVLPSITILPLHKEQFGRVLAEAMATGVAVVGSSSGAIPEVIGEAGLVVPEGDAAALAGALDRLLEDDGLRQSLAARGRHRAATLFDLPVVAARTMDLYQAALTHRALRRAGRVEAQEVGV